ncbi:MAG: fibronectin type III domain-containing protein [Flavobacteriales bacterium]|nr:fibronectin type III domain-containing protein [Flavobacteriales bacterium]
MFRNPCLLASHLAITTLVGQGLVPQRMAELKAARASFVPVELLAVEPTTDATNALWRAACRTAQVLRYDGEAARALIASPERYITLDIPSAGGTIRLDLERARVTTEDFTVRRASDGRIVEAPASVHYRGIVEGDPASLVSISVFEDELMGLIADGSGERVIGRFDRAPRGLHVFYTEADLLAEHHFACGTPEIDPAQPPHPGGTTDGADRTTRCVRWYWEAAYDIYQNKGSVANTVNYMTGLFNQSATIFANDGVDVTLLETFVWDVPSPYNGTSSSSRLSQFAATRTSFNGDVAHLLDYGGYGGVAWLNVLCGGTGSRMAYSGINSSYNNVPTYSWSVMVVTHEQGHNLGSSHTHACVWNGNGTAIDGCGPTAGYTEGSCPNAGLPVGGGTVMSYCHLIGGTGINLSYGFGPQPKQVIVDRTNAATCLLVCGTSCDAPGNRTVSPMNANSATLNWANTGAVSYTLRWKAQSSGTWTEVTGLTVTSYALTGLSSATAYEFQVLAVCASGTSAYSASTVFTTPAPCPDVMEPNETWQTAASITLPATVNALIATAGDQDHYTFTLGATGNLNIFLSGLAANYDLYLLNNGGSVIASSTNSSTTYESINHSATAGTYKLRVVGNAGAFNDVQCYSLYASFYGNACGRPDNVTSTAITYNSATINWPAVLSATSYELRWKPTAGSTWTTVSGIPTNSYGLIALSPLTGYDAQVRSICAGGTQGGGGSEFTQTHAFTTLSAPCEVSPPILIAAKLFLEGPYKLAEGLMTDSLRKQGWLPLNEPYAALGFPITGQNATTTGVLATTGNNAIVDWVLVELRDAATGATVIERKAALVQRDGDVTATDGVNPLGFCATAGTYRVAVRHRNHNGCMTSQGVALNGTATVVDFTATALGTYGTEARKTVGGVQVLWAGNTNGDIDVKYTGSGNDRDPILTAVGSTTPSNTVGGYLRTDVNMDGLAKYTGTSNDRDPILLNVGSTTPNNVRVQQLP